MIEEGLDRNPASATFGDVVELNRHNNAQYTVISMGDNKAGAYAFDGSRAAPCPGNAVKEHENCNGDARFITSLLQEGTRRSFYDDKAIFSTSTVSVANNEPAGCEQQEAITVYGETCPDGWAAMGNSASTRDIAATEAFYGSSRAESVANYTASIAPLSGHMTLPGGQGYFNIDGATGDYYMTAFRTDETVNSTASTNGNAINCEKTTAANKQKCFTKTLPAADAQQCPEGYKPIYTRPIAWGSPDRGPDYVAAGGGVMCGQ